MPVSVRRPRRRRALVLGALAALLLAEGGVRLFLAWRTGQVAARWEAWLRREVVPGDGTARLGQLLRPHPDPAIVYELLPDLDVVFKGARVRTSSQGFRGPERTPEPDPGVVRIFALGDSVLFGWGVEQRETWLARLEQLLADRGTGCRFETINTGVPGYNTAMEVAVLEQKGLAYRPDIVLIDVVGNDLDLPNFLPRDEDFTDLTRSFLWETCVDIVRGRAGHALRAFDAAPMVDGHFESDPARVPERYRHLVGLEAYHRSMARLAELAAEHGFEVLVTSHLDLREYAEEACARHGFPTADAGSRARAWLAENGNPDYRASALTLAEDDPHPTALLHAMQAEEVLRELIASGMLARAEARRCR